MNSRDLSLPMDVTEEISALIEALNRTEQRLDELTAGEVDSITDRHGRTFLLHRAQEQLREREAARQADILNALPAHIALLDVQGQISSVNEAWRQFARVNATHGPGYGVGVNYLSVCDKARGADSTEAREAAAGIRSVLRGEAKHFSLEYPCHSPTQQRFFLMTVTPLSDVRLDGAVVMHLDVTAERLNKEKLADSETRFRQMADNITDVFWVTSPDSKLLHYISPGYELIWGRSTESLYANPHQWQEAILPEERDRVGAIFATLMDKEPKASAEYRIARPDGTIRWVRDRGFQVLDAAGNLVGLTGIVTDITESKRAAAETNRLQNVLEASLNEIYIFDANTLQFDYVNDSARRNLGYTMAEMRQQTPLYFKPELTLESFNELIEPLRRHEQPKLVFTTMHRRADGSLYPVEVHLQLVEHAGKAVFLAVINDITERNLAESAFAALSQKTERRERMLSTALSSTSDFLQIYDQKARLLFVNQPLLDLWGIALEAAVDKNFFDLGYPDALAEKLQRQVQGVFTNPQRITDVTPYTSPAGRKGYYEYIFSPVFATDGSVEYVVGATRDITERKLAQQALQTSEAEFRTLSEAMPQIVWITRADGWNIYFNQQWMDYTGLTLEESSGHGWDKPFHPEDRQQAWNAWQKATETGGIYSIESRLRRADGVYRWWLVRGVPQLDASGKILKWFGTCTDIHDLKIAEQEITHSNQALRKSEVRIKYLNRVYAMLSGINTLIVRIHNRDELFKEACRVAVDNGGFRMSLICIQDRVTRKILPVASAGKDDVLMDSIQALLASEDGARTMVARAMREGKVIVSNQSKQDPQTGLSRLLRCADRACKPHLVSRTPGAWGQKCAGGRQEISAGAAGYRTLQDDQRYIRPTDWRCIAQGGGRAHVGVCCRC